MLSKNPCCPDRRSSHSASTAAVPAPLHPVPISPVDTRRNPDETAAPPPAPVSTSPPFAQSHPTRSVCPPFFPHRRRKVTARRQAIPDPIQVVFQLPFELGDRLFVNPCRSFIRFDSLIRFPDFPL